VRPTDRSPVHDGGGRVTASAVAAPRRQPPQNGIAMITLTDETLRASFTNATRREVADLTLPAGFDDLDWASLDLLGWRDPKYARRAYVVVPVGDEVVGVVLQQGTAAPRSRAQCTWCQDVTLPNDVAFFSARRSGAAGRAGDTVGTLVCSDFQCSANVRVAPPVAYLGFDVEAAKASRVEALRERAAGFVGAVQNGV